MSKKNRRKIRKVLVTLCCAMLLVAVSVGATFAYLTVEKSVTNTFTVGNGIAIELDEAKVKVDANGDYVQDGEERVISNSYDLHPGIEALKDPTIHIGENSDECWVVAKVTVTATDIAKLRGVIGDANGVLGIKGIVSGGVLADNITYTVNAENGKWESTDYVLEQKVLDGKNEFYVYFQQKQSKGTDLVVFDKISIPEDWDATKLAALTGLNINVDAYAIQAEGFATVEAAWNATFGAQA